MRIGFTGSQRGMTSDQELMLRNLIGELLYDISREFEFHHGDCIGADAEAHDSVKQEFPGARIVIHPPTIDDKRAFKEGDEVLPARYYIERNRAIVRATNVMIATPGQDFEVVRSGTWSTIRYARKGRTPCYVIFPSGEVELAEHIL